MTQTQTPTPTERVTQIMIGRSVDRVDGPIKTTGAAPFSTDYPLPGLAYAALTYATITRGRILAIDTTAAAALPGVLAVITHLNAPAMKPPPRQSMMNLASLAPGTAVNYLNTDEVHFNGQPVALVVAESIEAAAEGAALIDVRYQTSPAAVDFAAEQASAVPQKNTTAQVGSASKGTRRPRSPRRRSRWMLPTPRRSTSTTRSNRTRQPHSGTATG
jgi:xanthine dehydrogenase YagR molybdenum-binding subunit